MIDISNITFQQVSVVQEVERLHPNIQCGNNFHLGQTNRI